MNIKKGFHTHISKNIHFSGILTIGDYSIIGCPEDSSCGLTLGSNVRISRYCFIEGGVIIGNDLHLDDYCGIYSKAIIGNNVKVLYGKKIYGQAKIGDNCIIGGNIPERCIISKNVTFMGEVAHSHYNPKNNWDQTDEPSPIIGEGSIVGVNAILVGGITIGKNCYISTGEILRHDLPDNMVFLKNKVCNISDFRGLIKTRY